MGFAGQLRAILEKNKAVAQSAGKVFGEEYGKAVNQGMADAMRRNDSVVKKAAGDISDGLTKELGRKLDGSLPDIIEKSVSKAIPKAANAAEVGGRNLFRKLASGFRKESGGGLGIADVIDSEGNDADRVAVVRGTSSARSYFTGFGIASRALGAGASAAVSRSLGGSSSAASREGGKSGSAFSKAFATVLNSGLGKASIGAYNSFALLWGKAAVGAPALAALGNMVVSLVGSLFALGSAAVQGAAAIGGVLVGSMAAAIQGGAALVVAFKGIAKAIGSGFKKADAAGDTTSANAIANARRIEDARRRLNDAQVRGAEQVADAQRRVALAERDLTSAKQDVISAQKRLNAAYAEGREELEDLMFATEDAILGQERSALNLERAKDELTKVQNLPADNRLRRETELAFKEAELSMRVATDRVSDYKKANDEAAKTGLKGTKAVSSAENDVARAKEARAKAEEDLAKSQADLNKARATSLRGVEDAQRALTRALEDQQNAQSDAAKAANAYDDALKDLSPSAKTFVKGVVAMKDELNKFKKAVQEGFFRDFNNGFFRAADILMPRVQKELTKSARYMGDMAEEALNASARIGDIGGKGSGVANLEAVMISMNKVLAVFTERADNGHSAIDNIAVAAMRVLVALEPLTTRFATWLSQLAAMAEQKTENVDKMSKKFSRWGDTLALIGEVLGSLGRLLGTLGGYANDAATEMLEYFRDSFDGMNSSAKDNGQQIRDWFNDVADSTKAWLDLLGEIGLVLLSLGGASKESGANMGAWSTSGEVSRNLFVESAELLSRDMVPALQELVDKIKESGPELAELLSTAVDLVNAFTETESINSFLKWMDRILGVFVWIAETPFGKWLLGVTAGPVGFLKAIAVTFLGLVAMGKILLGSFLKMGKAAKGIKDSLKLLTKSGRADRREQKAAAAKKTSGTSSAKGTSKSKVGSVKITSPRRGNAVLVAMTAKSAAKAAGASSKATNTSAAKTRRAGSSRPAIASGTGAKETKQYTQAGKNSANGWIRGFKSKLKNALSAVRSFFAKTVRSAKTRLGIKSPSTVFAALGRQSASGFASGIRAGTAGVVAATRGMTGAATKSASKGMAGMGAAGKKAGGGFAKVGKGIGSLFSPIELIIAGILLLIFVFKSLYENNEGFRKAVDKLVVKVKAAFEKFMEWIKIAWEWIKEAWDKWGAPAFEVIKKIFSIYIKIWIGYFKLIIAVFKLVWKILKGAWEKIGKPIFDVIKKIVKAWFGFLFGDNGLFSKIKGVFKKAFAIVGTIWNEYIKPMWNGLKANFKSMISFFWSSDGKSGILNKIANFFGTMWDTAKELAVKGINGVISAINKVLISPIATIAGKFGLKIKKIPKISLASGGPVVGPGGPTSDSVPANLSNGEYVVKAASVKKYGPEFLHSVNQGTWDGQGGWLSDAKDYLFEKAFGGLYRAIAKPKIDEWKAEGGIINEFIAGIVEKLFEYMGLKAKEKEDDYGPSTGDVPGSGHIPKMSGEWHNPVAGPYGITRVWHRTDNYPQGYWAIDMGGQVGTQIRAINSGIVQQSYFNSALGWMVIMEHKNGIRSLYAHMRSKGTGAGRAVSSGGLIGFLGNTGTNTTGPHLHMEIIRKGGSWPSPYNYNPQAFLKSQGVRLATGGTVRATPGGVMAMLAEGGKHERVEPLDSKGLSARDYAMIEAVAKRAGVGNGSGNTTVRVYIGERELRDIVKYEVTDNQRVLARDLSIGRRHR